MPFYKKGWKIMRISKYGEQKQAKKWILGFIAALITMTFLINPLQERARAASSSLSESQSAVSKLEDQLKQAQNDRESAQAALAQAQNEKAAAEKQIEALDTSIKALSSEVDAITNLIAEYEVQITDSEELIAQQQIELDEKKEQFKIFVCKSYEDSLTVGFLDMIFSAESFSDLLARMDIAASLMSYEQRLLEEIEQRKTELENQKKYLEELHESAEQQRADKAEKLDTLSESMAEQELYLDSLKQNEKEAEALFERYQAAEEEVDKQLQKAIADLQKQQQSQYVGGVMLWPLSSEYMTISSPFGPRTHPVLGGYQFHNGIDIPAPSGTPIVAANEGTVITATYHYAYGNYIVIDHGGGTATMYAHCSSMAVTVGQTVSRGQEIGTVGRTGLATGYHLHMTIYENSQPVDPVGYYTELTLSYY